MLGFMLKKANAFPFAGSAASIISRLINIVSSILIVRLSLPALGIENYGVLAAVLSVITFFAFGDLGLGLSLMTEISRANAQKLPHRVQELISHSQTLVTLLCSFLFLLTLVLILFYYFCRTDTFTPTANEAALYLLISFVSLIGVPFALSIRVMLGLHLFIASQFWPSLGKVISVFVVWILSKTDASALIYAFSVAACNTAGFVFGHIWLYYFKRRDLRENLSFDLKWFNVRDYHHALGLFVLQLLSFTEVGLDAAIVMRFNGGAAAAVVDVVLRITMYIPAIVSVAMTPVWPSLTALHASAKGREFTKLATKVALLCFLASAPAALIFCFTWPQVIYLWTKSHFDIPNFFIYGYAVSAVLCSMYNVHSIILNSQSQIKLQVVIGVPLIMLSFLAKIFLCNSGFYLAVPYVTCAIYPIRSLLLWIFKRRLSSPTIIRH